MQLPPKDTEPSVLFAKLSATPRPHRIIELPRKDPVSGESIGRVAMVILTQNETILAGAEAEKRTRKLLGEGLPKKDDAQLGYEEVYGNLVAAEILFRACKDADDTALQKPAFKTPHEIGKAFSNDEIGVLQHHYLTIKQEMGPIVATMTDDEIDTWIRVLAEGSTGIPLDALSWGALTTLVRSMAGRLQSSLTDKSSAGSPAEKNENDEIKNDSSETADDVP